MVLSISRAAKAGYYYQGCGFATKWAADDGCWLAGDPLLGVDHKLRRQGDELFPRLDGTILMPCCPDAPLDRAKVPYSVAP